MIIGLQIIRLQETTSTMDEIDRLAEQGEAEGVVVVAGCQSAGRGRVGRIWQSNAGNGLLFSVLLRPRKSPSAFSFFPLVVGLAVAEAIDQVGGVECMLKWPNDVLIGDKKVAGILMTSRVVEDVMSYVNVGIGINVNGSIEALPADGTSVSAASGKSINLDKLFERIVGALDLSYAAFCAVGSGQFVRAWNERAAFLNEDVAIEFGGVEVTGKLRGVDGSGALLLERCGGRLDRIIAGELTRGPRRVVASNTKMANVDNFAS